MGQNGMRWTGWAAALAVVCLWAAVPMRAQESAGQNPYIQPQLNVRQLPVNTGATALWQTLLKLHTRASLLMIVAHPDDEDGGMLTYESRGMGVRTGMMTLTRGEGGQNVMTGDFNDALGLMRTQELLKEDEYDGVDQMFGSVADFGFSKTMDETLANWGYDRVLCDAVRAVRVYRPLVITSVFIGGVTDGHGHHQVAGRLAQEVFNAAGDASVCPDQIKEGLQPWQPLKVYERVPNFSISDKGIYDYATGKYAPAKFYNYISKTWSETTPSTDVVIPEGAYSPLLGMSYLQFSRIGWGQQLSQYGGSALPAAGEVDAPYHRYGSKVPTKEKEESFFDGIDTSLTGIAPHTAIIRAMLLGVDQEVTSAMAQFSMTDTAKIAPLLREGAARLRGVIAQVNKPGFDPAERNSMMPELLRKQAEFNQALVQSLGLSMRAQVTSEDLATRIVARVRESADTPAGVTPGESFHVSVQIDNPSHIAIGTSRQVGLSSPLHWELLSDLRNDFPAVKDNQPIVQSFSLTVPRDAPPTVPYFTRPSIEQPYYDIADTRLRGQPATPYPLTAWATLEYDGVPITLGEVVQTSHHVNGQGTVYQPLVIVPPVSVTITPAAGIIPLDTHGVQISVHTQCEAPVGDGKVHLTLPEGWSAEPAAAGFPCLLRGVESTLQFTVTPRELKAEPYTISAVAEAAGESFTSGYTSIGYPGVTPTNLYQQAAYRASGVDVHIAPGLRIAYLPGTGDDVPQAIAALGVTPHILTMDEIAHADLSGYDEIVLGVRAYNAHPELAQIASRLLGYAGRGGVVVVQYNIMPFTSTAEHPIAPYPFALPFAENVVEERAPVKLLLPEHPLLSWPNKITSTDFDGWVEERGHSFLGTWDAHYEALTETHDDGQDPQRGGLLYARTGCGAYVYVAYALYRQLPEGVPGAYRIFANLLSLPKYSKSGGCATAF